MLGGPPVREAIQNKSQNAQDQKKPLFMSVPRKEQDSEEQTGQDLQDLING